MRHALHIPARIAAVALIAVVSALPASATCTRLAFSVNDYGKDGPTKDAKRLLDKYVSKWAVDHGIKKFVTGKKDVSCEMFLNLVLFDEHTCKASASVCWEGPAVPGMPGAKPETASTTTTDAPAKPKSAAKSSTTTTTTGSIEKPAAKPEADKTEAAVKKDAPADAKPAAQAKKAAVKADTAGKKADTPAKDSSTATAPGAPKKKTYVKTKSLTTGTAKAAEVAKPKAPLPEKPESAPVQ